MMQTQICATCSPPPTRATKSPQRNCGRPPPWPPTLLLLLGWPMTARLRPGGRRPPEHATPGNSVPAKPIRSPANTHDADAATVRTRTSEDACSTAASKVVDKLRNHEPRRVGLGKYRAVAQIVCLEREAFGPTRWTARFIR